MARLGLVREVEGSQVVQRRKMKDFRDKERELESVLCGLKRLRLGWDARDEEREEFFVEEIPTKSILSYTSASSFSSSPSSSFNTFHTLTVISPKLVHPVPKTARFSRQSESSTCSLQTFNKSCDSISKDHNQQQQQLQESWNEEEVFAPEYQSIVQQKESEHHSRLRGKYSLFLSIVLVALLAITTLPSAIRLGELALMYT